MRNLILTGGHSHAFATASPALSALLAEHGIASTISDDMEGALAAHNPVDTRLITIYALRWSMAQDEKYAPHREQWAFRLSEGGRAAIVHHLNSGGGLLALHTALVCFDDWPEWKSILGGGWRWGHSAHPPLGTVQVRPAAIDQPLLRDVAPFTTMDEVYGGLGLRSEIEPLLYAQAGDAGDWQPVAWTREVSGGRAAVDALGHDAEALQHPMHRRIVARLALWALRATDDAISAV